MIIPFVGIFYMIVSLHEDFLNDGEIIKDFQFGPNDVVLDPAPIIEISDMRAKVNGAPPAYSGFVGAVILIGDGFGTQI